MPYDDHALLPHVRQTTTRTRHAKVERPRLAPAERLARATIAAILLLMVIITIAVVASGGGQ